MRIQKVEIQNLRCIKSRVAELAPYTCFVGSNGAGKSTVLCAVQGKSELIRPTIIALGLHIPVLVIVDADGDKLMKMDKETNTRIPSPEAFSNHERDNRALVRLLAEDESNLFPSGVIWGKNLVMWPSDLADQAKSEFVISLGAQGEAQFEKLEQQARDDAGKCGGTRKELYVYKLSAIEAAKC